MNEHLKQYLLDESKELLLGVSIFEDFLSKNDVAVYVGDYNYTMHPDLIDRYLFVVRDIKNWCGVLISLDMLENKRDSASAVIYLPNQNLEVRRTSKSTKTIPVGGKRVVYDEDVLDSIARQYRDIPHFERYMEKPVKTPVGIMSAYMLEQLLGVVNPITKTYEIFTTLNQKIHDLLSEQGVSEDVILTRELLAEHKVVDVLGVHQFDKMYPVIQKFLSNK